MKIQNNSGNSKIIQNKSFKNCMYKNCSPLVCEWPLSVTCVFIFTVLSKIIMFQFPRYTKSVGSVLSKYYIMNGETKCCILIKCSNKCFLSFETLFGPNIGFQNFSFRIKEVLGLQLHPKVWLIISVGRSTKRSVSDFQLEPLISR